ncbi:MAG: zinc ribbon domain-containing protein [Candidatus Omnitrophica bacterium]|nr:zinc ribbon domain-containing protein [Candidatus Omnitrophota bacterium]MDD5592009.1 zinc ribbon domain-containing protein [Candidatus Omnitrophota bacterium]
MPTYEYECTHCGHQFELFQKMTAAALTKCPKCNQKIRRLIGSGSGVIFKGKGFYATDYRKNPPASGHNPSKACAQAKDGCKSCPHK